MSYIERQQQDAISMFTDLETRGPPRIGTAMKPDEYVKQVRLALGLTQDAFAELLGIHARTIKRYEAGLPIPKRSLMAIKNLEAAHKRKRKKEKKS